MKKKIGYTTIELMIVVLIVTILAAVVTPAIRSRTDLAKWTEGKAMAGMIATSIRTWCATQNMVGSWNRNTLPAVELGINDSDLNGSYFKTGNFSWTANYDGQNVIFEVVVTAPDGVASPGQLKLSSGSGWSQ